MFLLILALRAFFFLHLEAPLLGVVLHAVLERRLHGVFDAILLRNAGLILEVLLLFGFAFAFELLSAMLHGQSHALSSRGVLGCRFIRLDRLVDLLHQSLLKPILCHGSSVAFIEVLSFEGL